jgi:hypothetical protein
VSRALRLRVLHLLKAANGSILSISARNIDSKSRTNAQHRFKSTYAPIRLLQISIPQRPFGDFCNNIGTDRPDWHVRVDGGYGG